MVSNDVDYICEMIKGVTLPIFSKEFDILCTEFLK